MHTPAKLQGRAKLNIFVPMKNLTVPTVIISSISQIGSVNRVTIMIRNTKKATTDLRKPHRQYTELRNKKIWAE